MPFRHGVDARDVETVRIVREIARPEFVEFWRELARPVILFDERSPADFLGGEVGEFSRKKRARQDSNLRPPA